MINEYGFISLCQPTKDDLYEWLSTQLTEYYGKENIIVRDGYIFAIGNIGTCLSAHIDTVFKRPPYTFVKSNGAISSPQGIGGDDRCGIYGVLCILSRLEDKGKKPFIFLSTDEEVGGRTTEEGAKFCKKLATPINFILALDRANDEDSVYYNCGNTEFKKWIDSFGFVEAQGTRTDICTLCDLWDVAGVNLSVGYYKNHTEKEYVQLDKLDKTIEKCLRIILLADPQKHFPYQKKVDVWNKYNRNMAGIQTSLYMSGDEVFTKATGATAYQSPDKFKMQFHIPAYESLYVIESKYGFVHVSYKNHLCWVPQSDILLDC